MNRTTRSLLSAVSLLICMLFIHAPFALASGTPRIINGNPASTTTYPWMAGLSIASADGEFESGCGGSLIAPTWILTAGHCFLNDAGDEVDATAGERTTVTLNTDSLDPMAEGAISVKAKQVIVHPNYAPNPETSANANDFDMALVELETAVELTPVSLMSATGSALPTGTETIVMGWGATGVDADNNTINPSNDLLQAKQKTVSDSSCADVYGGNITENMLCAGAVEEGGTTDTCKGDSGGPMVVSTESGMIQVGVVSFGGTETGPVCGDPDAPGVYARVSALNDFIVNNVPDAAFSDISPPLSDCEKSTASAGLDLSISCFNFGSQNVAVNLSLSDPAALIWQWDGLLATGNCADQPDHCATAAADLTLTVPGLLLGDTGYTLRLAFLADKSVNGEFFWQYLDHFEE